MYVGEKEHSNMLTVQIAKLYVKVKIQEGSKKEYLHYAVCPRSSDPFYTVTYYIKCVTTSWTYST